MNFRLLHLIFVFLLTTVSIAAVDISLNCNYVNTPDNLYTCEVLNHRDFDYQEVTVVAATGEHLPAHSNDNVGGVRVQLAGEVRTLPKGFDKVFKYIISIKFVSSSLQTIRQEDLRPYPNLKSLTLSGNQIDYLEPELFKFNPHLEKINVESNPLKKISPMVFSELKNLTSLQVGNCGDVEKYDSAYDREAVLGVVKMIEKGNCNAPLATILPEFPSRDGGLGVVSIILIVVLVVAVLVAVGIIVKKKFF